MVVLLLIELILLITRRLKMGYTRGEGLGINSEGIIEPIQMKSIHKPGTGLDFMNAQDDSDEKGTIAAHVKAARRKRKRHVDDTSEGAAAKVGMPKERKKENFPMSKLF